MINTETIADLIQFSKREDLQSIEAVRAAKTSFDQGDLNGAMTELSKVPDLKALAGEHLYEVIRSCYANAIWRKITENVEACGYSVAQSDLGFGYTVGLAKTKAELRIRNRDFGGISAACRILHTLAKIEYSSSPCVIHFESGLSVLLSHSDETLRSDGCMFYTDALWGTKDYPVLVVNPLDGTEDGTYTYLPTFEGVSFVY